MKKCIFCHEPIHFEGNNAEPLKDGICCNHCNMRLVIPYRMSLCKGETPRVKLIHMEGESQMERGLEGTISCVDDIGQIHVNWDNGSTLALNVEVDAFTLI